MSNEDDNIETSGTHVDGVVQVEKGTSPNPMVNDSTKALNTFGASLQAVLDDLYAKGSGSGHLHVAVRLEVS